MYPLNYFIIDDIGDESVSNQANAANNAGDQYDLVR